MSLAVNSFSFFIASCDIFVHHGHFFILSQIISTNLERIAMLPNLFTLHKTVQWLYMCTCGNIQHATKCTCSLCSSKYIKSLYNINFTDGWKMWICYTCQKDICICEKIWVFIKNTSKQKRHFDKLFAEALKSHDGTDKIESWNCIH